jgi:hypothetical protein
MIMPKSDTQDSTFLAIHIPELLDRFSLSYEKDDTCIEYFLFSKEKLAEISRSLIVSHEIFSKSLYVSKFYPEIYRELNCKYLSAACFYLMAHHAIRQFHLCDNCCVNLEAEDTVFDSFYSRLTDFDFKIQCSRPSNRVYVRGRYHEMPFPTVMISVH